MEHVWLQLRGILQVGVDDQYAVAARDA